MPSQVAKKRLSIVIPVFNEEPNISTLIARLQNTIGQLQTVSCEVIFVDDHSTDGSSALLEEYCQQHTRFRYLRFSRNSGSHIAILAGLQHAEGDSAVFMAADLQDPPELIAQMIDRWQQGSRVVWAYREGREGISMIDRLLSGTFYWIVNRMMKMDIPSQGVDFALLDRCVINGLAACVGANPNIFMSVLWMGFPQTFIPYTKQERHAGVSKWSFGKRLKLFVDSVVAFSFVPVRIISCTGILMAITGFLYASIVFIVRFVTTRPIEGWASLMVVTLIIGGIIMIMLGILGEYIWRAFEEARRRPLYFIESNV